MLLFVFDGVLLLRLAQRRLVALLFQLPPRMTRLEPPWTIARENLPPQQRSVPVFQIGKQTLAVCHQSFVVHPALPMRPFPPCQFAQASLEVLTAQAIGPGKNPDSQETHPMATLVEARGTWLEFEAALAAQPLDQPRPQL
ncbi:MAG: hypothetical protein H6678_06180 [Candidatus Delongbacteria bacterium]|nr:hypothetical protein [Candidatus Delongbacteria bacterium]